MTTAPPDPAALLRSRSYLVLLALAAIIGVPISAVAYGFLALVAKLQQWVSPTSPRAWASTGRRCGGRSRFSRWPGSWSRLPFGTCREPGDIHRPTDSRREGRRQPWPTCLA